MKWLVKNARAPPASGLIKWRENDSTGVGDNLDARGVFKPTSNIRSPRTTTQSRSLAQLGVPVGPCCQKWDSYFSLPGRVERLISETGTPKFAFCAPDD